MRWTFFLLLAIHFTPLAVCTPLSPNMTLTPPSIHHLAHHPHPPNTPSHPSHPLTFLGITCYHLLPTRVTLQTCQPLFAALVQAGDVYTPYPIRNGWVFQSGYEPCVIRIESSAREDRGKSVRVSMSQVVLLATEVLETCRGVGSGGANGFEGSWRLVVMGDRRGRRRGKGEGGGRG